MTLPKIRLLENVLFLFTSTRVVLVLFGLLVCFLVPLSIFNELRPVLIIPAKLILSFIFVSLAVCTVTKFKILRRSTLLIHLGSVIIFIGGFVSGFGFVATLNVYEGDTVDTAYNWNIEQDVSLGFDLLVDAINMDFYPVGVKIGVLKNGQKADLFESRTEDFFVFEKYRIQILRLDPFAKIAYLSVESLTGEAIGTMSTEGERDLSSEVPLDFKLVAFQDPQVKRMWVNLELQQNGKIIKSGTSEVNHPFKWQGINFFLTQVAADDMNRPYAGIQISKDPGVPYVYAGFAILCLGLLLALKRWIIIRRRSGV